MPTLTLIYEGKPLAFSLQKIDRAALYGYVESEAVNADGEVCSRALLAGDGHTIAGKGDTALAYLSPDGLWRERSELRSVDARDGAAIVPVKPTFAFPVNLEGKETCHDEYLNCMIRLVYRLQAEPDDGNGVKYDALLNDLLEGGMFRFPFSYRGGDLADDGFLLCGSDNEVYLAVGSRCHIEYASLAYNPLPDPDELDEEEEEELDFSMV
jgi:hypothetical protein